MPNEVENRTLNPSFLKNILTIIDVDHLAAAPQLVFGLVNNFKVDEDGAKNMLSAAVEEGFLAIENKKKRRSANQPSSETTALSQIYRFPKGSEIRKLSQQDPYCFECHLPKNVQKCRKCHRSFHEQCKRLYPEKPLYAQPSGKKQKNRPPTYTSDDDYDDIKVSLTNARSSSSLANQDEIICVDDIEVNSTTLSPSIEIDNQENNNNDSINNNEIKEQKDGEEEEEENKQEVTEVQKEENVEVEAPDRKPTLDELDANDSASVQSDTKIDVVYVGQIRKASRRSQVSVKAENFAEDDEDEEMAWCTCCRLLYKAAIRSPPNRHAQEISHLLKFTFQTNKSWLSCDVLQYIEKEKSQPEKVKELLAMLFVMPMMSLQTIELKLNESRYRTLNQFLVDILDLQHVIGVFFGDQSCEFEQTKWFVRDLQHDIAEIRRCPDCFRYSNEKVCSIWFALPCVQRHELVYAKQSGFPYWPAKVIRVAPNGKYDVRFFGPYHSRALVDPRFIKPTDTPTKSLNMGYSAAMRKAFDEMSYHTNLMRYYTPEHFAFQSSPERVNEIVNHLLDQYHTSICPSVIGMMYDEIVPLPASGTNTTGGGRTRRANIENRKRDARTSPSEGMSAAKRRTPTAVEEAKHALDASVVFTEDAVNGAVATRSSTGSANVSLPAVRTRSHLRLEEALTGLLEAKKRLQEAKSELLKQEKLIDNLKSTVKKLEATIRETKRTAWCQWCFAEAKIVCCISGLYCSVKCQTQHLDHGHRKTCPNAASRSGAGGEKGKG